MVEFY